MTSLQRPSTRGRRLKLVLVAVSIVVILIVAGYALTLPGPKTILTIIDGSINGTVQGDFLSVDSYHWMYSFFNATTYANQTGHPSSKLTLQVVSLTHWSDWQSAVETVFYVNVLGDIDSNLSAENLQIIFNQTASDTSISTIGSTLEGSNVSFDPQTHFTFWDNDSRTLTLKLVNQSDNGPIYRFSFLGNMQVMAQNHTQFEINLEERFVCIRAVVNGWFEPEFSVAVMLRIVNTSTGF